MSGKIIEFRRARDLGRARLYRQQAVPRAPAGQATPSQQTNPQIARQIARISRLLEELEALTRGPQANGEDDPQPDVDRGLLDRMYRALDHAADSTGANGFHRNVSRTSHGPEEPFSA